MYFDFCVGEGRLPAPSIAVDTIFYICGDTSYCTPRKPVTPGKTYFVYTILGSGLIRYDELEFTVSRGDYVFMRPTENFSYQCEQDVWHFWWFEFPGPPPSSLGEGDIVYNIPANDFILALFEQSLVNSKNGRWDIASSLFISAASLLNQAYLSKDSSKYAKIVRLAEQYIRENLRTATVAELCTYLQMNDRTVRNLFYRTREISPKQFICNIRLDTARQMLENTLLPIEDIAQQLGFSSQFHLSRSFKERFGLPPLRYRKFFQHN